MEIIRRTKIPQLYTGYLFVPLTTPLTSTSWDGDTKTTADRAIVDLSAVFGSGDCWDYDEKIIIDN